MVLLNKNIIDYNKESIESFIINLNITEFLKKESERKKIIIIKARRAGYIIGRSWLNYEYDLLIAHNKKFLNIFHERIS